MRPSGRAMKPSRLTAMKTAKRTAMVLPSAPFASVHVVEEELLPTRRSMFHAADPVHELGGAQDSMRGEREGKARVFQHRRDRLDAFGVVRQPLVGDRGRPLVAVEQVDCLF